MTKDMINQVVSRFTDEVKNLYGDKLHRVILYGSCARGDYEEGSDIDIMVILDIPQDEIKNERGKARTVANNLDKEFDYNVLLMPTVQSKDHFEKYENILPLFSNIHREGIAYV